MKIEVSNGELIDKITILEIKSKKITNLDKLQNIKNELEILNQYEFPCESKSNLYIVNEFLWNCEENIRKYAATGSYDSGYIDCSKDIHTFNDERARIKKEINIATSSSIIEEKSHSLHKSI